VNLIGLSSKGVISKKEVEENICVINQSKKSLFNRWLGKFASSLFLFFIFSLCATNPGPLLALPESPEVETGSATFETADSLTLNINADDKTVINFNSFNIAAGETVNFIQPSNTSSVLSRVTGSQTSSISGALTANGILFLTNPNGINFGLTANVQVNSLIASSLDITTNNFINGNYIFEHNLNSAFSQILNQGRIAGNNIALIASSVKNTGIIQARAGTARLASGDKTTLTFDARGLIQVAINVLRSMMQKAEASKTQWQIQGLLKALRCI
jgi:filamentous hemagglutinin family protein